MKVTFNHDLPSRLRMTDFKNKLDQMRQVPKSSAPINALHADVRRLLKKYKSEFELHQVRAQFMGAIASPIEHVNPMKELKRLWKGGELPPMKNMAAANELIEVFAMGLWNKLTAYSDPEHTFPLTEFSGVTSDAEMRNFAQIKREEIESFVDGFFQGQETIKLPPEVGDSLDVLEDLVSLLAGFVSLPKKVSTPLEEITYQLEKLFKLRDIAQTEINTIIVNSQNMRRQGDTPPPTLH